MKTILIVLITLAISPIFGQKSIDLANVYYRTSPFNSVKDSLGKKQLNTIGVDVKLPIVLNKENVLILGADYQQSTIGSTQETVRDMTFSTSTLQIGLEHKWNKKSKMLFMSMTRLNSDFNSVNINHFQQGGLVLGTTARNENFDWKYGMYYNAEFFGHMFVPLFGFNWKMNEHWRFKLVVPVNMEISYTSDKNLIAGLKFEGVNGSFRTNQNPMGVDSYIDKADNNLWAFTEFEIGKNVWFHAKAGYSILRKYRMFSNDESIDWKLGPVNFGDDRSEVKSSFENGLSFEARFIYRLPIN